MYFDKILDKVLRVLPAILFYSLLSYPVIVYFLFPELFLWLTFPFFVYMLYRSFIFSIGTALGYRRFIKESAINWVEKCYELNSNLPNHLVVIPVNKESFTIIKRQVDSIIAANYPLENIYIAVTIENRADYTELEEKLNLTFGSKLGSRLKIFKHLLQEGEVPGAAANRTNGAKQFVDYLTEKNIDTNNFLITSPDVDTVFSKEYFARVGYEYLKESNEKKNNLPAHNSKHITHNSNYFYQTAVYKFDNNIWEVPILIRILSVGLTMSILSSSFFQGSKRFTFSCFTMQLNHLIAVDFWDVTLPIDDTPLHWRMHNYFNGNWQCKPVYVPINVDAIQSSNYFATHRKQYQQFYRWGWGVISLPLAVKSILKSGISIDSLFELFRVFEVFILIKVFPIIVTLIVLLNSNLEIINSRLYDVITIIANINLMLLLPIVIFKFKLVEKNSKMKDLKLLIVIFLEIPLGFINLITYGIIPYMHAATAMCFGKRPEKLIKWSIKYNRELEKAE